MNMDYPGPFSALRELDSLPDRFHVDVPLLEASFEHAKKYGEPTLSWSCDDEPLLVYSILTDEGEMVPAFWVPADEFNKLLAVAGPSTGGLREVA